MRPWIRNPFRQEAHRGVEDGSPPRFGAGIVAPQGQLTPAGGHPAGAVSGDHKQGKDGAGFSSIFSLFRGLGRRMTGTGPHAMDIFGPGDEMIGLHGADGRFIRASLGAQPLLGLAPEQLSGHTLSEFVAPEQRGAFLGLLARAAGLRENRRGTFRLIRPDCETRFVDLTITPVSRGRLRTICRDVTEVRLARAALDEARSEAEALALARARHLADLSHEIRTPLNAVIGFAEIMERETFGPLGHERYQEYAELIHRSGDHLLSLVSDLLDLSKIEAQRYQLEIEECDLAAIARDAVQMMQLSAEQAGLTLRFDGETDLCLAQVDARSVRQMILNLLSNAIKFTRTGTISLSLTMDDHWVRMSVTDTGIGMSAEAVARMGGRYEQAHTDNLRHSRSTGLGLALVRSLSELHGGEMKVESTLGEGTKVSIILPRVSVLPGADQESAREEQPMLSALAEDIGLADEQEPLNEKDQAFENLIEQIGEGAKRTAQKVA